MSFKRSYYTLEGHMGSGVKRFSIVNRCKRNSKRKRYLNKSEETPSNVCTTDEKKKNKNL